MELIEKLQKIIEREIDNVPMVLTDPLTLRRLRAERLAQAALTALIEHAGGDGVTEGDKRAATELMVGPKVAGGDGQTYVLRTPSYSEASEAFARHRATAFAAGKAARDREIVASLRHKEAFGNKGPLGVPDWAYRIIVDAIERGEV